MELTKKHCVPCEAGTPPLTPEQVADMQKQVDPAWRVENNTRILREFTFPDFLATMKFVNQVAELAEAEGHHPDLHIFYGRLKIELWTHAIGGLSENDFILAAKIDSLFTSFQ